MYKLLGTIYNILFLTTLLMMLMNLIIAILTTAYDEAVNQSDVDAAQSQYDELESEGFTKIRSKKEKKLGGGQQQQNQQEQQKADKYNCIESIDMKIMNVFFKAKEVFM